MVSGQSSGPMPQGPYPAYQPMYQPPHRHPSDYMKSIVSDMILALAVVVGLFLIWLGSLIAGTADTSDGMQWGTGVKSFGMLALTVAFILGAMLRHDLEKWVRVALLVSATLLIIFVGYWAGFWMWSVGLF